MRRSENGTEKKERYKVSDKSEEGRRMRGKSDEELSLHAIVDELLRELFMVLKRSYNALW